MTEQWSDVIMQELNGLGIHASVHNFDSLEDAHRFRAYLSKTCPDAFRLTGFMWDASRGAAPFLWQEKDIDQEIKGKEQRERLHVYLIAQHDHKEQNIIVDSLWCTSRDQE